MRNERMKLRIQGPGIVMRLRLKRVRGDSTNAGRDAHEREVSVVPAKVWPCPAPDNIFLRGTSKRLKNGLEQRFSESRA